jgi:hypothetical protein
VYPEPWDPERYLIDDTVTGRMSDYAEADAQAILFLRDTFKPKEAPKVDKVEAIDRQIELLEQKVECNA